MKQSTLKTTFIALAATLFCVPAVAQLSLSASADASADSSEGVNATATDDANAEEDPIAAEPAPMIEPEPEPMIEPAAENNTGGSAGYDKGFYIKSNDGNFKLVFHGMVKTRFDFLNDEKMVIGDTGEPGKNHTMHAAFNLPYARLYLTGHMFTPKLSYAIYYDFVKNMPIYMYAQYAFIPGTFQIKVGLFKRPISRPYLTSSVKRQFIDDSIGHLGAGLDVGVEVGNGYETAKGFAWAVGVFNGSRGGAGADVNGFAGNDNGIAGGDFSPVVVGRVGYNYNGINGYSATDFEGGPLRFSVGLSLATEFDHDNNEVTTHTAGLDAILKIQGLSVSGGLFAQSQAQSFLWDTDDETAQSGLAAIASYIQAGYLIKEMIEPVARYAFQHDFRYDEDLRQQITAGLALHFIKNNAFKWENNIRLSTARQPDLTGEIDTFKDILFSSQLQFFF
jgi:hypothetical protein